MNRTMEVSLNTVQSSKDVGDNSQTRQEFPDDGAGWAAGCRLAAPWVL